MAAVSVWRVELWTKPTDDQPARLVAVVGDYDPASLDLAQTTMGTLLAFTPSSNGAPAALGATWQIGGDPATAPQDDDGDGLPDGWEIQHGLNPRDSGDALRDDDGDGADNKAEFEAGTNPSDPASVFRIRRIQRLDGTVLVEFAGTPARRFYLERTLDPGQPDWIQVAELSGRGGVVFLSDPEIPAENQAFYRLRSVAE